MKTHRLSDLKSHSLYRPKERTISLGSSHWKRLRRQVLESNPLCFYCKLEGRITPADTVDHYDNNGSNNNPENLIPCCHSCNSKKGGGLYHPTGCDVSGRPADPEHEWNRENHEKGSASPPTPQSHAYFRKI